MTESANNITRLPRRRIDRTAGARQQRRRDKLKAEAQAAAAPAVTPEASEVVTRDVTQGTAGTIPAVVTAEQDSVTVGIVTSPGVTLVTAEQSAGVTPVTRKRRDGPSITMLLAALGIASVSAFFSITGLTHVFTGAFWPIIAMGCALECSKLASVAWLGRRHGFAPLRIVMIGLVTVLMLLSAVGSYGYLSFAHVARVAADQAAIDARTADVESRNKIQTAVLADVDRRISQIDAGIEETIRRGRAAAAMALAGQLKRTRADLVLERAQAAQKLAGIEIEMARVHADRTEIVADDGPIAYISALLGISSDTAMRSFILLVAMLLDPLACALLLAAAHRGGR